MCLVRPALEGRSHAVEVVRERADLVAAAHCAAVTEIAGRERGRILSKLPQRPHDAARQHPGDRKGSDQRAEREQRAPAKARGDGGEGHVPRQSHGYEPGCDMRGRGAGDALYAIRPDREFADIACREMVRDSRKAAEIPTDPIGTVDAAGDHGPMLVHDRHHAAGRQVLDPERFREALELGPDRKDALHPTGLIANRARDGDDPSVEDPRAQRFADRELAVQRLPEIVAVTREHAPRGRRGSDIAAVQSVQPQVGDIAGQPGLDPAQDLVVGGDVRGISRDGLGEAGEEIREIGKMIIDLRSEQSRVADRALECGRAVVSPLAPKADSDQRGERHHGGEHQPEQSRSNAAKQHRLSPYSRSHLFPCDVAQLSRKFLYNSHHDDAERGRRRDVAELRARRRRRKVVAGLIGA